MGDEAPRPGDRVPAEAADGGMCLLNTPLRDTRPNSDWILTRKGKDW